MIQIKSWWICYRFEQGSDGDEDYIHSIAFLDLYSKFVLSVGKKILSEFSKFIQHMYIETNLPKLYAFDTLAASVGARNVDQLRKF